MKTSSCKAKGRRACQRLKDALISFAPDLQNDDLVITSSGDTGEDLKMSPTARKIYPLVWEVKAVEKLNVHEAYKQAVRHWEGRGKDEAEYPALAFTRNHADMFVMIKLEHFLKLIR